MTNEDSVIREVDEELAHERQWEFFRKNGPALIGAAAAVVASVGGWQYYNYHKAETARRSAMQYAEALKTLEADETTGAAALKKVIDNGAGAYPLLARLQEGALLERKGDRMGALADYRAAAEDRRATKHLRQLARLRAAYLVLEDGREAVLAELGPLAEAQTPLGYYAREIVGVAAIEAEDYDAAAVMFRRAAIDLSAPEPVRQRAEELAALASAGKAGVNISGKVRTQDLLRALGEDPNEANKPENSDKDKTSDENGEGASASDNAGDAVEPAADEDAAPADGETSDASENG